MQTVVLQVPVSSSQRVVVDCDCLYASATEFEKYMPDIINIPKTNIADKTAAFLPCMIIRIYFPLHYIWSKLVYLVSILQLQEQCKKTR